MHQLLDRFAPGEATTDFAVNLRLLLQRAGHRSELFAGECAAGFRIVAAPPAAMTLDPKDAVIAHLGDPSAVLGRWMHLRARRVLVFHGAQPRSRDHVRAQLAAAAPFAALTLVTSARARAEAEAAGHQRVTLLPNFVETARFASAASAPPRAGFRVAFPDEPSPELAQVVAAIRDELRRVGGTLVDSRGGHAARLAALEGSDVLLTLGETSGLRIAEAMAAGVPVIAFAAGPAPDVLRGSGIQFDAIEPAPIAELCRQIARDSGARVKLINGQHRRLAAMNDEAQAKLLQLLPPGVVAARPARKKRSRVGIVVQRFGDVGGGAEALSRMIAERLARHLEVEVVTSRAASNLHWDDTFPSGTARDPGSGLTIHRLETTVGKDLHAFNALSKRLFGAANDRATEERWLREQGPLLSALDGHLEAGAYDALIAFTYLYWPTVLTATRHAERTLVVPTAHPEPAFNFGIYADVFERPAALLCNTPEELELIARRYPRHAPARVVGVGIDAPPSADPHRFRRKYAIDAPFLLYVGRLENGKGIEELIRFHRALREQGGADLELVLAGAGPLGEQLRSPGVRAIGRISEVDKYDALAGAAAAVVPSRQESLSLFVLEACSVGTPVIGNGHSEVVAGQLARSGAGATYTTAATFVAAVGHVLRERERLGKRGLEFAAGHRWDRVIDAYLEEIERVGARKRTG